MSDDLPKADLNPVPVVVPRPKRVCGMFDAIFRSHDALDTFVAQTAADGAGIYTFSDKSLEGWWPRVYKISFNGNETDAGLVVPSATKIEFGFRTHKTQTIDAGDPPLPEDVIYSDTLPTFAVATADTPTIINTNFGKGWLVPAYNGVPADFYCLIRKDEQVYGATLTIMWAYERVGGDV